MHSSHTRTALLALAAVALFRAVTAAPVPKYATVADSNSNHNCIRPQSSRRPSSILDVSVNPVGARDVDIIYLYQRGGSGDEQPKKKRGRPHRRDPTVGTSDKQPGIKKTSNRATAQRHRATANVKALCVKTWKAVKAMPGANMKEADEIIAKYPQLIIDGHRSTAEYHDNPGQTRPHMSILDSNMAAALTQKEAQNDLELGQLRLGRTLSRHPVDDNGRNKYKKKGE